MEPVAVASPSVERWARRRHRARHLAAEHPFAAEMLRLYTALLDVQERAFAEALATPPDPAALAPYVAGRVMADIARETIDAGPPLLAEACRARLREGELTEPVRRWLSGEGQSAVEEYLARAAAGPVLEALGPAAGAACRGQTSARGCPRCGGRPQLSYVPESGESLVTAPRRLLCCRCGESWVHARMSCPGCGEQSTAKLPIYADGDRFPHLRADACERCRRYLLAIDLRKDPLAVPVVDELAALPLDLYVQELGFAKISPNLLGIG